MKYALSLCVLFLSTATTQAGLIYAFDQTNYEVAVNETVHVQVFLQQTGPIIGDPADLSVDGLVSGSVQIFFNDSPPTDPASVIAESDILPNPAFDESFFGPDIELISGVSAAFVDGVDDPFSPVTGTNILLGTFTFTGGSVIGEVTSLRTADWSGLDDTIAGNAQALDAFIGNATSTITTIAAVPEPSTFMLLFISAAFTTIRRRR